MKELVIDSGSGLEGMSICISGARVEMVESTKFLGMMITYYLSWSNHVDELEHYSTLFCYSDVLCMVQTACIARKTIFNIS
eukprot:g32755.t1